MTSTEKKTKPEGLVAQQVTSTENKTKPKKDPGLEFMGDVTKEMAKHDVRTRKRNVNVHRDQGIVERFSRIF